MVLVRTFGRLLMQHVHSPLLALQGRRHPPFLHQQLQRLPQSVAK